jgi:hypothetical protein
MLMPQRGRFGRCSRTESLMGCCGYITELAEFCQEPSINVTPYVNILTLGDQLPTRCRNPVHLKSQPPAAPITDESGREQVALKLIDGWLCGPSDESGREQVALKLIDGWFGSGSDGAQDGSVALAAASAERDRTDAATATLQLV